MAITERTFAVGNRVVARQGDVRFVIEAVTGDEKRPVFWQVAEPEGWKSPFHGKEDGGSKAGGADGRTFLSLGFLEDAITYPKLGPNRYQFFTRLEDEAAEVAEREAKAAGREVKKAAKTEKAVTAKAETKVKAETKKAAKATEKAAKAAKRDRKVKGYNPIHQLEDGRWFCDGCMDAFEYEGEGDPADCPNGHVAAATSPSAVVTDEDVATPAPKGKRGKKNGKTVTNDEAALAEAMATEDDDLEVIG